MLFGALIVVGVILVLTWYVQFRWNRRSLYRAAAKFDGPAGWPLIGNALGPLTFKRDEAFMEYVTYLVSSYPKMMRMWIGPELVIGVYNPEALEVLLNHPKSLSKKDLLYRFFEPVAGLGLVTASVPKWKRHRKTINPSFNQQVLNGFMDTFSKQSTIFVDQLHKCANKGEFNVIGMTTKFAVDVTCETIMGVKYDQRFDLDLQHIMHCISKTVAARLCKIWLQFDFIFDRTQRATEFRHSIKQFHGFVANVIKDRRKIINNRPEDAAIEEPILTKRKAFLDLLLENSNFTEEELNEEVNTFMLGGSDTIGIAAGFILIMLGMHNDVQENVLKEVLRVVGPDRPVELTDLPDLKYTECVIKETLRLFPPFPYLNRSPEEDIPFQDGMTFPKGSIIFLDVIDMHRSDKYWADPLKFIPDRFSSEEIAKRHPYCFLPFSAGPRNCIGHRFAYMLLKTMIATLVRAYKVSTKYKKIEDIELTFEVTLGTPHGHPVSLTTRRSS